MSKRFLIEMNKNSCVVGAVMLLSLGSLVLVACVTLTLLLVKV
ncbi:hypothetical protein JCM19239_223 [Vibrio variabilis]|uniref:Lipoprotein n=1 Tax=Vibrio variabilis TaxID=990271 RepID=A0ABQ0JPK6_9VIBR|nr:hypothetical protein JCM19239_223 [Vibrio variabilis]